jgi:hypothetical protein
MKEQTGRVSDLRLAVEVQRLHLAVDAVDRRLADCREPQPELFAQLLELESSLLDCERELAVSFRKQPAHANETDDIAMRGGVTRSMAVRNVQINVYPQLANVPTAISDILTALDRPFLVCRLTEISVVAQVRLTAYLDGFSAPSRTTVQINARTARQIELSLPLPPLHQSEINLLDRTTNAMLNVLLEDVREQRAMAHVTLPIWLLPRHIFPFRLYNPYTAEWWDSTIFLAAHVTPTLPAVIELAQGCANEFAYGRFRGYQQPVLPQISALYRGIQREIQLRHEYASANFNPMVGVLSRKVRTPRETLAEERGGAADGALLFASLLDYVGIDACLAVTPATVLVGWQAEHDGGEWTYMDMTKIDKGDLDVALAWGALIAAEHQARRDADPEAGWWQVLPLADLRARSGVWPVP